MALGKTASNVLKFGASAAGVGLMFTPVGGALGLSGLAAAGVDMAAAPVTGWIGNKVSGGLKHVINDHTEGNKDKSSSHVEHKSDDKKSDDKNSHNDEKKISKSDENQHKMHPIKDVAKVSAGVGGSAAVAKMLAARTNNSNGRSTGNMTSKFMQSLSNMGSQKSQDKYASDEMQRLGLDNSAQSSPQQQL